MWLGWAQPARPLAQASGPAGLSNTRANSRVLLHSASELKFTCTVQMQIKQK
jgi:hypothetical protein